MVRSVQPFRLASLRTLRGERRPLAFLFSLEGREDRAGPGTARAAFAGQPPQRIAGALELADLLVERLDPGPRELASAAAVLARVQVEQLLDLLESKPRRLRLLDETQPPQVIGAVAADFAIARGRLQQTPPLVIADRLNPPPPRPREPAEG